MLPLDAYALSDGIVAEILSLAFDVAKAGDSPHGILTDTYSRLMYFSPRLDVSTASIALVRGAYRKERGAFYTPAAVARLLTEATLDPLNIPASSHQQLPSVLDPAMGTGVFLCQVVRYLALRTGRAAADVAETCLHGIDLDPTAIEIAVVGLWLETGARPDGLAERFHHADALRHVSEPLAFDVVLSNPPWGAVQGSQARENALLALPASRRPHDDSFELFLALGSGVARHMLGMLVPKAVLAQSTYSGVRGVLLQRMDPYRAIDLGDGQFEGVAAPACGLVWGPKPGPDSITCTTAWRGEPSRRTAVPRSRWTAIGGFPLAAPRVLDMLEHLRGLHPTLGDLTGAIRVHDVGINYNRASLARRVLYESPAPDDPRDLPRYRGRNFGRYTSIRPGGWLRHNALDLAQPQEKMSMDLALYSRARKLVFRQTADRIVATLDNTRMAFGRSVIAITAADDTLLLPLLACLNSRLVTLLYRTLSGEDGRVLPQVKVARILAMPVPSICRTAITASLHDEARGWSDLDPTALFGIAGGAPHLAWAYLAELAARHLEGEGQDSDLDHRIEVVVCALYGVDRTELHRLQTAVPHRASSYPGEDQIGPGV